jgi:hypothetical protein
MFASHLGHDKHHSLCLSFILFPSRLRLVGSAFCLLRSLSCFLLALPKSVPCLEMFGFLYSITIYALSGCASYNSFQKHCVAYLFVRDDAQIADVQSDKRRILRDLYRLESSSSPLRSYTEYFFSLLWVKAYGDF